MINSFTTHLNNYRTLQKNGLYAAFISFRNEENTPNNFMVETFPLNINKKITNKRGEIPIEIFALNEFDNCFACCIVTSEKEGEKLHKVENLQAVILSGESLIFTDDLISPEDSFGHPFAGQFCRQLLSAQESPRKPYQESEARFDNSLQTRYSLVLTGIEQIAIINNSLLLPLTKNHTTVYSKLNGSQIFPSLATKTIFSYENTRTKAR